MVVFGGIDTCRGFDLIDIYDLSNLFAMRSFSFPRSQVLHLSTRLVIEEVFDARASLVDLQN